MKRLRQLFVWGAVLSCLAGSLLYRAWQRGDYYPGWDILGPAHGVYTLSTLPPLDAIARLARGVYRFRYWNATNSLVYTLIPGILGRLRPSAYWGHWLTFGLVLLTFGLARRAARLPWSEAWLLALAWCSSSALLSFAVAGYPYATGFLPHALALLIVTSAWSRARPLFTLLAALLACELSWHLYEAGKTLVVVLLLAAVLERAAPLATRAAWVAASAVQLARLFVQRGYNVDYVVKGSQSGLAGLSEACGRTVAALLQPGLDLPVLVPLGILALGLVRRHRWLLAGCLASQLVIAALAAAVTPGALLPRRVLTLQFYSVTILAFAWKDLQAGPVVRARLARSLILPALLAASVWQVLDTWTFYRVPPLGRREPLPFTSSADDYLVAAGVSDLAREIEAEVRSGRAVVLLYNLSSETLQDPAALVERSYLVSGHHRFTSSVLSFGVRSCRYDCQPIRPLDEIAVGLTKLADSHREAVAFYSKRLAPRRHVEEAALVLDGLAERFWLEPRPERAAGFGRLALLRRIEIGRLPQIAFSGSPDPAPLDLAWLPNPRVPDGRVRVSPLGDRAFRYDWSAEAVAARAGIADVLVGCAGDLSIDVNGVRAIERSEPDFTLWRERLPLPEGRVTLKLSYRARSGSGRLVLRPEPLIGESEPRAPASGRSSSRHDAAGHVSM